MLPYIEVTFFRNYRANPHREGKGSQDAANCSNYIAHETAVDLSHTIRETEISSLLDSWFTNMPLSKFCIHKNITCPYTFLQT